MYTHVKTLAEAEKKGIEEAGGTADLYQYVPLRPCVASARHLRRAQTRRGVGGASMALTVEIVQDSRDPV